MLLMQLQKGDVKRQELKARIRAVGTLGKVLFDKAAQRAIELHGFLYSPPP